ncbi:MAG: hypothetical protein ACPGO5_03895 [Patescibacteria group bacterium]
MKKQLLSLALLLGIFGPVAALAQANTVDFGTDYLTGIGLGTQDIRLTVVNLIRVALGILGVIVLVIIIAGGFRWMTAGGNDDAIAQAKSIISAGIIGLIIIIVAYALTTWVFNSIISATLG